VSDSLIASCDLAAVSPAAVNVLDDLSISWVFLKTSRSFAVILVKTDLPKRRPARSESTPLMSTLFTGVVRLTTQLLGGKPIAVCTASDHRLVFTRPVTTSSRKRF
jgi:hypothetical protein